MSENSKLKPLSSQKTVAILAVDNISPSEHGLNVLRRIEDGLITYEQAKEEILLKAREMSLLTKDPHAPQRMCSPKVTTHNDALGPLRGTLLRYDAPTVPVDVEWSAER